jgi:hypothetical protein
MWRQGSGNGAMQACDYPNGWSEEGWSGSDKRSIDNAAGMKAT